MVVFCIQQQGDNEEAARKEASDWAKEILTASGEYLNGHLRKQVNILLLLHFPIPFSYQVNLAIQEGMSPDEEDQIARRIVTLGKWRRRSYSIISGSIATYTQTTRSPSGSFSHFIGQTQHPTRRDGKTGMATFTLTSLSA